jgi:hypothetical protein
MKTRCQTNTPDYFCKMRHSQPQNDPDPDSKLFGNAVYPGSVYTCNECGSALDVP